MLLGQATDFAQGERNLSFQRKNGMAAGEDEAEAMVFDFLVFVRCFVDARFEAECRVSLRGVESRPLRIASMAFKRAVDMSQGRGFPVCQSAPGVQGGSESLTHGLFGKIEIAEQVHQSHQNPARFGSIKSLYGLAQLFGHTLRHPRHTSRERERERRNRHNCEWLPLSTIQ